MPCKRPSDLNEERRPFGILIAFIAAGTLVCGCAKFTPQPIRPADSLARLESHSLTNTDLRSFLELNRGQPLPSWPLTVWDADDLTLAAFYYNPDLRVARTQFGVALAGQKVAAQRPNPTLTVTPGYNTTTFNPSPWIPLGYLDFTIETAGKRAIRQAEAKHLSVAAKLNLHSAAWQLRSRIRSSLTELAAASERTRLLENQIKLHEQIAEALEQQVRAGAISPSEGAPFRIALTRARLELAGAQAAQVEVRSRLAETVGVPLRMLDQVQFRTDLRQKPDPAWVSPAARTAALHNRTDVLAALAEYDAAQTALQLQCAKQYPDFHLQPGYEFDQGDNKWSLGMSVELPVFHHNQGQIAQAEGQRQEAAARFYGVQAKALAEIDRQTEMLRASESSLRLLQTLTHDQAERSTALAAQVKAGAAERLDWLQAEAESTAAQLAELEGAFRFSQAVSGLEDAIQTPELSSEAVLSTHIPNAP